MNGRVDIFKKLETPNRWAETWFCKHYYFVPSAAYYYIYAGQICHVFLIICNTEELSRRTPIPL